MGNYNLNYTGAQIDESIAKMDQALTQTTAIAGDIAQGKSAHLRRTHHQYRAAPLRRR